MGGDGSGACGVLSASRWQKKEAGDVTQLDDKRRGRAALLGVLVLAIGVLAVGCAPKPGDAIDPFAPQFIKDDIASIVCFWKDPIWITDRGRPVGFRMTAFFVSTETDRGAFVPGVIRVRLYEMDEDDESRTLHMWELPEQESRLYRLKRYTASGCAYGLALVWPEALDVCGRSVDIDLEYETRSGRTLRYQSPRTRYVPRPPNRRTPGGRR